MSIQTVTPPATGQTGGFPPFRLVKAELLKIWTTNTWWIFGILYFATTALSLLLNIVIANESLHQAQQRLDQQVPENLDQFPPEQRDDILREIANRPSIHAVLVQQTANVFTSGQFFGLLFVVVLGCLIVTNEYFHQTATATFLTTPHRSQVILSKFVAGAGWGLVFWFLATVVSIAVGSLYFSNTGREVLLTDPAVVRSIGFNLLAYVIWAILGISLGVLLRSQIGATLTATLAYLFSFPIAIILFQLIRNFVIKDDSIFNLIVAVPGVASMVMVSPDPLEIGTTKIVWWVGALVLVGYGVVGGVLGTLITRKRDIS